MNSISFFDGILCTLKPVSTLNTPIYMRYLNYVRHVQRRTAYNYFYYSPTYLEELFLYMIYVYTIYIHDILVPLVKLQ